MTMTEVNIFFPESSDQKQQIDLLLWDVLWKPLGLPRNIRDTFRVDGHEIEMAVEKDKVIVGALVGVWASNSEVELRHLAVAESMRKQGVGCRMVETFIKAVSEQGCLLVHTIARNTSEAFFRRIGFTDAPGTAPDHPDFRKHGITFVLLRRNLSQ